MSAALGAAQTAFWGIVTFSILVVFHEMGHFLAARAFGVKVHEFMIGLPGPSLRLHTRTMDWGVTAVPLGGYVRIAGMEPGDEDPLLGEALALLRDGGPVDADATARALGIDVERASSILAMLVEWKAAAETDGMHRIDVSGDLDGLTATELADRARASTYRGQSVPKRITILAMGVVTNLLVALLTLTAVFSIWGYYDLTTTIDAVETGSPAAEGGLREGDTLLAVDGEAVATWDEFQLVMARTRPGQRIELAYERGNAERVAEVVLAEKDSHGFLGVGPTQQPVPDPTLLQSLDKSVSYMTFTLGVILDLFDPAKFTGTVRTFTGVIGVSVTAERAVQAGPLSYAGLIAILSLSLGLMNVLPIPPLDGGKIALEIVERVLGRPLPRQVTLGLSAAGAVLLFSLIGYVMYLDIVRYAT